MDDNDDVNAGGWNARAWQALVDLAESGRRFTSDDLLDRVGHPDKTHAPNRTNNRVGSVFQAASRQRLIMPVGVVQSKQPHRKGGMVREWVGRGVQ